MKPIISVISIFLSLGTAQAATIFSTTNTNTANNAGNNYFGSATQSSNRLLPSCPPPRIGRKQHFPKPFI